MKKKIRPVVENLHANAGPPEVSVGAPVSQSAGQRDFPVVVARASADNKQMQEGLAESEQKYRQFFQSSRDALMTFASPSWIYTSCNPATLELFGAKTEEEFFSFRPWDISSERQPDGQSSVHKAQEMIETAAHEGFHFFEWQHQKIGGVEFPADVLLTCIEQKGKLVFQASVRNITERKREEEKLRASEAKMRTITEAAQDAILMMDPGGLISYWNPAAESIFGYRAEEAIGMNLHELLVHEPHLSAHRTAYPEFQRTGQGNAIGKTVELSAHRKDGQEIAVSVSLAAVLLNGKRHSVGIVHDITERKRTEINIRRLATVVRDSNDAITIQDFEGRITAWNRGAELMYGWSEAEALLMNIELLTTPDKLVEQKDFIRRLIAGEAITSFETQRMTKGGRILDVWMTVTKLMDDAGNPVGLASTERDITERKKAANALQELNQHLEDAKTQAEHLAIEAEAKSEFLAVMSHELRNPLNGVLGFAEILSDTALDDEQKDYVRMISSSGEHLLAIVNDTLDFSSIEAGTMVIHSAPFDLAHLVKLSSNIVRKSAADKGLSFHCDVAADVPAHITGDERRIRQILINLLANAVKFTSDGSVSLRVTKSSEFLDFSVEDTGFGISSEALVRLFQLFTQADSTINQKYGGTGIGLAVSKRLAEAMGGKITVASAPGMGSTFTFHFPLKVPAGGMASLPSHLFIGADGASPSSPGAVTPVRPDCLPVLVVEDDRNSRTLAGKLLHSLGYRVEFAGTGVEAVEAFAPGKYLAILMDLRMPVMNGFEAAAIIRSRESGSRVPIIVLSANVLPGSREIYLAAGMDDYLAKPFKMEELAAKLACMTQIS